MRRLPSARAVGSRDGCLREPYGNGDRRAAMRMSQGVRERQEVTPELYRGALRGSQDQATETSGRHGHQELVSELGSASDGRNVSGVVASKHRDSNVLPSSPKRIQPLADALEQALFALNDGHDVLGIAHVPGPCTAGLHDDKRDQPHVDDSDSWRFAKSHAQSARRTPRFSTGRTAIWSSIGVTRIGVANPMLIPSAPSSLNPRASPIGSGTQVAFPGRVSPRGSPQRFP